MYICGSKICVISLLRTYADPEWFSFLSHNRKCVCINSCVSYISTMSCISYLRILCVFYARSTYASMIFLQFVSDIVSAIIVEIMLSIVPPLVIE